MKHAYKISCLVILFILIFSQCVESKITPLRPKCKYSCCPGPRGAQGLQGEQGIQGPSGVDVRGTNFLFAYDTTSQVISMPGSFQELSFSNVPNIDGWVQGTASKFTGNQSGLYSVDYTITLESGMLNTVSISVVGLLDSVEIPGSQSSTTVAIINRPITYTKKFLMQCVSGQTFNLSVTATDPGVTIKSGGDGITKSSCSLIIQRIN